jgi:hypothetical protein
VALRRSGVLEPPGHLGEPREDPKRLPRTDIRLRGERAPQALVRRARAAGRGLHVRTAAGARELIAGKRVAFARRRRVVGADHEDRRPPGARAFMPRLELQHALQSGEGACEIVAVLAQQRACVQHVGWGLRVRPWRQRRLCVTDVARISLGVGALEELERQARRGVVVARIGGQRRAQAAQLDLAGAPRPAGQALEDFGLRGRDAGRRLDARGRKQQEEKSQEDLLAL